MTASLNARARVRAELTREIVSAAQEELACEGAAGVSLRAVARRLGMVPSALYRYFPNRDGLLTALIIEAYRAVGAAAADADASSGRVPADRWRFAPLFATGLPLIRTSGRLCTDRLYPATKPHPTPSMPP